MKSVRAKYARLAILTPYIRCHLLSDRDAPLHSKLDHLIKEPTITSLSFHGVFQSLLFVACKNIVRLAERNPLSLALFDNIFQNACIKITV